MRAQFFLEIERASANAVMLGHEAPLHEEIVYLASERENDPRQLVIWQGREEQSVGQAGCCEHLVQFNVSKCIAAQILP